MHPGKLPMGLITSSRRPRRAFVEIRSPTPLEDIGVYWPFLMHTHPRDNRWKLDWPKLPVVHNRVRVWFFAPKLARGFQFDPTIHRKSLLAFQAWVPRVSCPPGTFVPRPHHIEVQVFAFRTSGPTKTHRIDHLYHQDELRDLIDSIRPSQRVTDLCCIAPRVVFV
jgi:hypothetical protein